MKPATGTSGTFHETLKHKMDAYAHLVYFLTKSFPRDELYGVTSQLRRAALSVALNYIEGYGRARDAVHKSFLEISYGSLKESKYLLRFSLVEGYLSKVDHDKAMELAEDIGAMLWGTIRGLEK